MELRPYQTECLDSIDSKAKEGLSRQMVVLPTGSGKTVIFSELIKKRNVKTLVIAHRIELLEQALDKLVRVAPDVDAGIFSGDRKCHDKQVTIASIQAASNALELLRAEDYQLLIIDEAHHAAAPTYQKLIKQLGFKPGEASSKTSDHKKLMVGFTATTKRGDKIGLKHIFQDVVFSMSIRKLVHRGFLVKPEGLHVKVGIDLKGIRTEMGDFKKASLRKVMLSDQARGIVVETIKRFAADLRGIVFSVDIEHSELLKKDIQASGFSCDAVHSKVSLVDRKQRLEDFASGKLQFIVNPMILTEGFDCPRADCMINAAPTKNKSLYIQKAGRVLRIHPEKEKALLIDFGSTKKKHSLATAIDLMGGKIVTRTVTDCNELFPPPPKKEEALKLDLEATREKYDPLSDHNAWENRPLSAFSGPSNSRTPATSKQKNLIRTLSKSTRIRVDQVSEMDIGQARRVISFLINKNKEIQKDTPLTSKQEWYLKKLVREQQVPGLDDKKIHELSKHEARSLIGKLQARA